MRVCSPQDGTHRQILASKLGMGSLSVDSEAVRAVAQRFGAAADLLDGVGRNHLNALRFTGAIAGRAHTPQGDEWRRALDRLSVSVAQWSRAAAEIAATLQAEAGRYADAELRSAARVA